MNSFIHKSLRIYFWKMLYFIFGPLILFCLYKNLFLNLHQVKAICYCDYFMLYGKKEHYSTKCAKWCLNNFEMTNFIFSLLVRKINKSFAQNFYFFYFIWMRPINISKHTNSFFSHNVLLFCFYSHKKIDFVSFSDISNNNLWIFFNNVLCFCKTLNNDKNK